MRNQGGKVTTQEVSTECHLHLLTEGQEKGMVLAESCVAIAEGTPDKVCGHTKRNKPINNTQGWQGVGK